MSGERAPGEAASGRIAAEYVLPIKRDTGVHDPDLDAYLASLVRWIDVTVVDGSDDHVFAEHASRWPEAVRHIRPAPSTGINGKVAGVVTGLRRARHERVVIADDDVRYDHSTLRAVVRALAEADIVRPQNYFDPLPWHARWDTARTLVNRAFSSDYPGTLAVRRDLLVDAGGYDPDVLFENLELIRTVTALGGRELRADGIFVLRRPPEAARFIEQRVRQAYDDFAQPVRLVIELALLPGILWAARRPGRLVVGAASAVAIAEIGRRRAGGVTVFPRTSALWAPLWIAERAICVWVALVARLRGGVRYRGRRILRAANSERTLRTRMRRAR